MSSPANPRSLRKRLRSLRDNERGTVAVITAAAIVPLVLSMGVAVDLTRAYMARAKLTAALDTAGLAVGANPSMTSSAANSLVSAYLQANFPTNGSITVGTAGVTQTSTTLTVTATAQIKTSFMGLAGLSTIPVTSQSTVAFAKSIEVAMVLDNTGSLSYPGGDNTTGANSNIMALKTAAGHFVVSLFGTATTNNPQTRVGIVPYVAAVNPGSVAASMLDPLSNPPPYQPTNPAGWTGCVVERPSTFAAPMSAGSIGTDLDTPVSAAKANYLTKYWWPNDGTFGTDLNWTTASSIYMGPFINGNTGGFPNTTGGPNQSCPTPVVPMTNNLQPLLDSIGADATGTAIANKGMQQWQHGGTAGSIGMAWGYRMLSSYGPFAAAGQPTSKWNTAPWQKAVVLMTDGVNAIHATANSSGVNKWDYTGYPGLTSSPPSVATIDAQEELVCDELKTQGVVIYSVFLNSGSSSGGAISYCAGQTVGQGDPAFYYNAQNQTALYAAFNSIANSLTKLRISK
ncbi:MAG TPA: TadE/TadG family type IV pilus assembly protein [Aliidongia sp.]|uniref:TadE/TadG family type IV pilus assembly protein n=1 Tax=Aliidongia sp. TaxID=1914230 RepID=UPI002DDDB471|nr:TadE/TadG family type IV pilus assembly protein [Aliidongia sp.]HEV2676361.1 TadE/TadG family type IV pilus assembly protein [Aliidongia sp.]